MRAMGSKAMIALAIAVAVTVLMIGLRARNDLDGAEARRLVAGGALLLDVRTNGEFKRGHVPGATNISVTELTKHLGGLGAKDRDIVVYCASGARSSRAQSILRKAGFTKVRNLGGIDRWPGDSAAD